MKRKIIAAIVLVLLVVVFIMALLQKPSDYILLKNTWKLTNVVTSDTTFIPDTSGVVQLNPDFSFTTTATFMPETLTGLWRLTDSIIYLTYNYQIPVDSIIYSNNNGNPELQLLNNKSEVSSVSNNKLANTKKVQKLYIKTLTENNLTITLNNNIYTFTSAAGKQVATDINVLDIKLTSVLRGILGMLVLIFIAWLFSSNRKAISWKVVGIGLAIQLILAFGILKVPAIAWVFETVGKMFVVILNFTGEGSKFLLGDLLNTKSFGFIFAFQVLPTIIFFSALTSLLFYVGIIQKVVYVLAWLLTKALKISGAESLSVAGNIFLGQTEAPLMIKAYLEKMNRSEIMMVMSGGMATLAGGVLASYIAFLGGDDPVQRILFAKHLIAASVMAAPGVIVLGKIIVPQTEPVITDIEITKDKIGSNVLDAISNGTTEGLKLAANVAAMLLSFIAFIAMFNFILRKLGAYTGLNEVIHQLDPQYSGLDLKFILGYIFAPIVWLMGVTSEDITLVGRLLGEKLIMTEFIAYISLTDLKSAGDAAFGSFAEKKSIIMATYALAGFANFASIGIQIGGIGTLAPGKRTQLSELGFRALLAGSLASMMSATMVGMLIS